MGVVSYSHCALSPNPLSIHTLSHPCIIIPQAPQDRLMWFYRLHDNDSRAQWFFSPPVSFAPTPKPQAEHVR